MRVQLLCVAGGAQQRVSRYPPCCVSWGCARPGLQHPMVEGTWKAGSPEERSRQAYSRTTNHNRGATPNPKAAGECQNRRSAPDGTDPKLPDCMAEMGGGGCPPSNDEMMTTKVSRPISANFHHF